MIRVAILGATGTVGQKFICLLQNHPQFSIAELVASDKSAGKTYAGACTWLQPSPIPDDIVSMTVRGVDEPLESQLLFSGLDSAVALEIEKNYAKKGHTIISNASSHRMANDVPLVIPEINHTHLNAITQQGYGGPIITNPNCATMAFIIALAPLHQAFGVEKVLVHTMQSISGAGYPGVSSMEIQDNLIPFIRGEEEKIKAETKKILGTYDPSDGFTYADITIDAHCNRVQIFEGHTANVSLSFTNKPTQQEIREVWKNFKGFPQDANLHSAPLHPVWYFSQDHRPQPRLDIHNDKAMATNVGRLRSCNLFDYTFTALGHNTIRGAAGAAILNAETLLAMNVVKLF